MSLTTVGYGDIYPASDLGRVATMLSSLIALPAGILTGDYMDEMRREISKD